MSVMPRVDDHIALRPKPDRRSPGRLALPPCERCQAAATTVTARKTAVLDLECRTCQYRWRLSGIADLRRLA